MARQRSYFILYPEAIVPTYWERTAVQYRSIAMGAVLLVLAPVAEIDAQSLEIQTRVEAKLWYLRALDWIEAMTGLPPAVALSIFLVLVLLIAVSIWIWSSRRNRDGNGPPDDRP